MRQFTDAVSISLLLAYLLGGGFEASAYGSTLALASTRRKDFWVPDGPTDLHQAKGF
jgi:hypothetical protein